MGRLWLNSCCSKTSRSGHGAPPETGELPRIEHIRRVIELAEGDLLDQDSLKRLLRTYHPAEVYNLAAIVSPGSQSFRAGISSRLLSASRLSWCV